MKTLCARIRVHAPRSAGPSYPADSAAIMPAGAEVSTFLRCYHYREGDCSAPHFDKSYTEHADHQLSAFSGYSVLLYLNDGFEGGGTTFFHPDPTIRITRSGLTPVREDLHKLRAVASVEPRRGDVLIFPHGNFNGCHPNPLHEGSVVTTGEKLLIRTDLVFRAPDKKCKLKNKAMGNAPSRPRKGTQSN